MADPQGQDDLYGDLYGDDGAYADNGGEGENSANAADGAADNGDAEDTATADNGAGGDNDMFSGLLFGLFNTNPNAFDPLIDDPVTSGGPGSDGGGQ
jgi:hypothetical protein